MDKITQQYERRQLRILSWPSVIVALGLVLCSFSEAFPQGPTPDSTLAAGYYHTCAVLTDGQVKCWGPNHFGALEKGRFRKETFHIPVTIPNITNAVAITAGDLHTCAVLSDGRVQCWGDRAAGQFLGNKIKRRPAYRGLRYRQKRVGSHLVTVEGLDNVVVVARNVPFSPKVATPGD